MGYNDIYYCENPDELLHKVTHEKFNEAESSAAFVALCRIVASQNAEIKALHAKNKRLETRTKKDIVYGSAGRNK